jgi:hypothetical protein
MRVTVFAVALGATLTQAVALTSNNAASISVSEALGFVLGGAAPAELPSLQAYLEASNATIGDNVQVRFDIAGAVEDLTKQAVTIKQKYTQAEMAQSADFLKLLTDIQTLITNVASVLTGVNFDKLKSGTLVKSESERLCFTLGSLINVAKDIVDEFIGPQGFFSGSLLLSPIVFFLRAVENGLESFLRGLVDVVPSCKDANDKLLNSLRDLLAQRAQTACKGFC